MEKRTHISKELLSTEQSYVRSLKIITTVKRDNKEDWDYPTKWNMMIQCYMAPLLQWVDTEKSEVTKADLKQIFLNIDVIISIHNELLRNLEVEYLSQTQIPINWPIATIGKTEQLVRKSSFGRRFYEICKFSILR